MLLYDPVQDSFLIFNATEIPKVKLDLPEFINFTPSIPYTYSNEEVLDNLPRMIGSTDSTSELKTEKTYLLSSKPQKTSTESTKATASGTLGNYDISFEELIKLKNLPIRINSGYRGKGSLRGGLTALGRRSNHNRRDAKGNPMAYDISPKAGYTWEDLRRILYKDPDIVSWFKARGWGVLEEMMDGKRGFYNVDGRFCYTGATGPHFHIGPDSAARKLYAVKIAKAQQGMKFNFPFMLFTPVEDPKVEIDLPSLDDPLDISNWASEVTPNGRVIVKPNLPRMINDRKPRELEEVSEETDNSKKDSSALVEVSSGSETLSKIIDEVAQESGYEGLKNPETKKLIMLQAQRESKFNPKAEASNSTAAGYFLFIDLTRQSFSKMSKDKFLNNPKEQVRAAYKLFEYIHSTSDALKLLLKGYNKAQVTALGWWYPRSMSMVLNGKTNFSIGGYSILQALNDYK